MTHQRLTGHVPKIHGATILISPFFGFSHLVLFSPPSRTQTGHTSPRNHCRGITQYHSEWWVANPPNIARRNPEMGPGTLHGPFRWEFRQDE